MSTKDLFSGHSTVYATFRPAYPEALYTFIFQYVNSKTRVWDCGTGNGQAAGFLADHFSEVYATDISRQQLDQAVRKPNIHYSVSKAEESPFKDASFDLITVGQALHWFDREKFYNEARRTGKPGSILAVWGYANLHVNPSIDKKFGHFYDHVVGPYWDEARRLVEQEYRSIEFPFEEIAAPKFSIDVQWALAQFAGYLSSWSATQKFIKVNGRNPVEDFIRTLGNEWREDEVMTVTFPVFLRLGMIR